MPDQPSIESIEETSDIHSVYLSADDKSAAEAIASLQGITPSDVFRKIFDLYLDGKLEVSEEQMLKTSLWIKPDRWAALRAKTRTDKVPVRAVISAGIRKLTTGR